MSNFRYNGRSYYVKKIYLIICPVCDEDITRPETGEDIEDLFDVKQRIHEHDETHDADPGQLPIAPRGVVDVGHG